MKRIITFFALILIFSCSCTVETDNNNLPPPDISTEIYSNTPPSEPQVQQPIAESAAEPADETYMKPEVNPIIENMTLKERVSQLFVLALNSAAKANLESFVDETRAGGYVLFANDITTAYDTRALTDAIKEYSIVAPFICIDEEGGTVSRLYSAKLPGYTQKPSAAALGSSGDKETAYNTARDIGGALASIGVTVNFAPVTDVFSNPANTVIKSRSFGRDPVLVGDMAAAFIDGLHSEGIFSAAKHFPGHGNTTGDTHMGSVIIKSDMDHLRAVEFHPFIRAIEQKTEFVMVGHISAPEADPSGLPATLSEYLVSDVLRTELGFTGIIVTDAMNMGAITKNYSPGEAAVMAICAGVDMILMPEDFISARDAVIKAVEDGTVSQERINESLMRIISTKNGLDYSG